MRSGSFDYICSVLQKFKFHIGLVQVLKRVALHLLLSKNDVSPVFARSCYNSTEYQLVKIDEINQGEVLHDTNLLSVSR